VLLYDTEGDRVLYAEDADQPWYAASLTKMMTAYVVFDAWKSGRVKREDKITISAKANAQAKVRLGLGTGKEINYDDAVKALIMKSANDIAYALAEATSGDMETFVGEMNARAAQLGLVGTRFINPHGLPGEGQHTTAKDMARLAAALMRDYPEHMGYFSLTSATVGEKKKASIGTHNPVLVGFEGGDGFKTGFTCSAGYNIVASATRDGRRLVVVVLGEETPAKRATKTKALLEYGFKIMGWKALFKVHTIHSLPDAFYDREKVVTANLDKRYEDCRGPEMADEESMHIAEANPKSEGAKAMAAAAATPVRTVGPVVTGSIAPATGKPVAATPAAAKPAPAATADKPVAASATSAAAAVKAAVVPSAAAAAPAAKPVAPAAAAPAKPPAAAQAATPAAKAPVKVSAKRKPAKPTVRRTEGVPFSLAP
jgi:D-alanyl-D-alanine carboxypeptidase